TRFTRRMPFTASPGTSFDQVGNALHAFLAADRADLPPSERTDLATQILQRAGLHGFCTPEIVIPASDALHAFAADRWPNATWHREIPISAGLDTEHGRRRIAGSIDLLLETPAGYVIVDHKSFPGRTSEWGERALTYAPQLFTYAKAIRMTGAQVL